MSTPWNQACPAEGPQAGWHQDPSGNPQSRWWDGSQWTSHVTTQPGSGAPSAPEPAARPTPPPVHSRKRLKDVPRNFAISALMVAIVALALCVGSAVGLHGVISRQSSQDQAAISRLQAANQQLAAEVAKNHAALAGLKVPSQVNTSQMGICYDIETESFSNLDDSIMDGYAFVDGVDIESPNLLNGVVSCPSGDSFVPVVPANNSTNSNS